MYKALALGVGIAIAIMLPMGLANDIYIHVPEVPVPKKIATPEIVPPTPVGISARAAPDKVVVNTEASVDYVLMTKWEFCVAVCESGWRPWVTGSSHLAGDVWTADDRFFQALWLAATCGKGGDFIKETNDFYPPPKAQQTYEKWNMHIGGMSADEFQQYPLYDTVDAIDDLFIVTSCD